MQAAPQRAGEGKANVSLLVAFILWVCVSVCQCMIVIEYVYMGDVRYVGWSVFVFTVKYLQNCQKCSDLGRCLSIGASLLINKYFRAVVGSAKLGCFSQMHAAFSWYKGKFTYSSGSNHISDLNLDANVAEAGLNLASIIHWFRSFFLTPIMSSTIWERSSIIVVLCDFCSIGCSIFHSAARGSATIWISERLKIRFVLIDHEPVFFTAWKLKWSAQGNWIQKSTSSKQYNGP